MLIILKIEKENDSDHMLLKGIFTLDLKKATLSKSTTLGKSDLFANRHKIRYSQQWDSDRLKNFFASNLDAFKGLAEDKCPVERLRRVEGLLNDLTPEVSKECFPSWNIVENTHWFYEHCKVAKLVVQPRLNDLCIENE